jgi:eukaryotic-like serine/threonine-protein kinase
MTAAATTRSTEGSPPEDVFEGSPYRVLRRLSAGGTSDVFLVLHEEISREFVAKVLREACADDAQLVERVRVEARSLARLHHPNIVEVTDFRRTRDGRPFFVMERLTGRTVQEELAARRTLSVPAALDRVHQALSALSAAHALGIVHRDIKPDNLFLCELDQGVTLKVLDFGIARIIPGISSAAPEPVALSTVTGAVLGSPRYSSPEAARGSRVDHRADLYSLALVFYEMVAGRGPFDHRAGGFSSAHRLEDPDPPSAFAKEPLPAEIDAAILRGLRKNPAERYQSAAEFQDEVERLWALIQNSQALETTFFSAEEARNGTRSQRIRGRSRAAANVADIIQDREPVDPNAAHAATFTGAFEVSSSSVTRELPRRSARAALLVASLFVAAVTAVGIASLIAFLIARGAP